MSTVHAATNNQNILDSAPKAGSKDLRRNRSVFNNIIPTSTGAAIALEEIIPEIKMWALWRIQSAFQLIQSH